jgi:hypothetical protein
MAQSRKKIIKNVRSIHHSVSLFSPVRSLFTQLYWRTLLKTSRSYVIPKILFFLEKKKRFAYTDTILLIRLAGPSHILFDAGPILYFYRSIIFISNEIHRKKDGT